jgi:hypothetical protein
MLFLLSLIARALARLVARSAAVGEQDTADDIHLPQLHRPAPFPALEPAVAAASGLRVDQPRPLERPIDPRARRRRLDDRPRGLVDQPAWTPVRVATTGFEHPDLDGRIHLMRTTGWSMGAIGEPAEPLILIPPQPPVHRLARDSEAPRDLHHRNAITDHREHRLIPLFHDTQLHQHARECVADQAEPASPIRRSRVTHQAKPCHPSGEADMSRIRRNQTNRSAPGRIRTCDLRIRSPLLYPLSYRRHGKGSAERARFSVR